MKKPNFGDRIEHTNAYDGNVSKGTVEYLLSTQFVYKTDDGRNHYCLFREAWKPLKEGG